MKKSLEETLKEVELCKEIYRLYALEHLTMSEISVKFGFALSSIHNKIRKFEAENPELAENMKKKGKEIIPEDYKQLLQEIAELKKQVKSERASCRLLRRNGSLWQGSLWYRLKKAGTK